MQVSLFDFELPDACIAHHPVEPRDAAKLLHVSPDGLHDRQVRDLPTLLRPGDILVFNDSRVIPARLFVDIGGRQVEVLLHRPVIPPPYGGEECWSAFAKPARRLKEGMQLDFAEDFCAKVAGRTPDGQVLLAFPYSSAVLMEKLHIHGHIPLPPYITRPDNVADATHYQTIYATKDGSVAAPTAGLHFTPDLMQALRAHGIATAFVTLHVGAGTFQPVKVEDTQAHVMHREWGEISAEAASALNAARAGGGRVVAVGTTSLRILESFAHDDERIEAASGETGIFITPGYRFKLVDCLMTNFHLPKSTLFMLTAAFSGLGCMQAAYAHAIARGYRFYSYGDACFLEKM